MPSFDVVSEVDHQEVRNAVDQAQRELTTRYDFKGTNSTIEQADLTLTLRSASKVEEAAGGTVRQVATLTVGISSDKARELNGFIKKLGLKGIQSQTQGDQLRVSGKKRDDLQAVIAKLKEGDFGIALQFSNFRD